LTADRFIIYIVRLEIALTSARAAQPDPRSFLPLTPLALHVLLALGEGALHGYAIIQEVASRTDELIRLRSGTLYTLLQRLEGLGLILEVHDRGPGDDQRRRYYALTRLGREVLAADLRRLETAVLEGRRKRLLGAAKARP
jgi:DNA-binding PadR family transcriptional regulator